MPTKDDHYNTSHNFHIRCGFPDDVEVNIVSRSKDGNGILFEGSEGNIFVSRGKLCGKCQIYYNGILLDEGEFVTSSVGYTLTYDTRDDIALPSTGIIIRGGQEFAGLGGDIRYIQSTATVSYTHLTLPTKA